MAEVLYPKWIKSGDCIGVTAPSDGNWRELDIVRLENAVKKLENLGYRTAETKNVRTSTKGRSSSAAERAKQFMYLMENKDITYIVSAKGGDFLMEILPYLDFEIIKKNPKWIQGYSDNTGLIHTVTTICGMAAVYGNNFNDFGMEQWHPSVTANLEILEGTRSIQNSFEQYEDGFSDRETGLEGYNLTEPVCWDIISRGAGAGQPDNAESGITMKGRLLGGCLDVLIDLAGTRFDKTAEYVKSHAEDGILWYLESFELGAERLSMALWKLKEAGWFQHASGFVFGRPAFFSTYTETTFAEAVLNNLGMLGVPVVIGADIGHKAPQLTMINGALATIAAGGGKGSVRYTDEAVFPSFT